MTRHGGDQRQPCTIPVCVSELERPAVGQEQAQPAGTVIVTGGRQPRPVFEATRIVRRCLGLEIPGELAKVVQAEQETSQAERIFSWKTEQPRQTITQLAITGADRGHVEAMKRQRMPLGSAIRISRTSLPPKAKDVHGLSWRRIGQR